MKSPLIAAFVISASGLLAGCAVPVVALGGYAADGGLYLATGKSSTDHLVSMNTKRDCGAVRAVLKGGPLCKDRPEGEPDPYHVDPNAPFRAGGDSGVEVTQSAREGGRILVGDDAREALASHKPPDFAAPTHPTTATPNVPGEARFGAAGQPAAAPTPEGADVAAAGSRIPRR
ncbi:MAG: hypothetical protein JO055_16840 [Alphaproteobacteria bacterium]|nr:hypothetical protein [Alphaproteobacteria bacterium]